MIPHTIRPLAALALVALAATACQPKKEAEAKKGPVTATVPASGLPNPKAGLWEQTMSRENMTMPGGKVCLDDALSAKVATQVPTAPGVKCTRGQAAKQADGSWLLSATCDMGAGGVVKADSKISGDFNSDYTTEVTTTTTGAQAPQMNRTASVSVHAKYLGACPADWKPGDVELPGGVRRHSAIAD